MVITGVLMASVAIFGYQAIVWLNRLAIPGVGLAPGLADLQNLCGL